MTPRISIITVTYNAGDLLQKTINSIQSQTLKSFEHIVIDGGSKDQTLEIIERNRNLFAYFISEKDNGIYDAMNKGLAAAKGEYILFLNAGDLLYSNDTLEKIFKNTPADVYYGDTLMVDFSGNPIGLMSKITTRKLPENLKIENMALGMVVCHQSFIVSRKIAPMYNLEYRICGDLDWVIQCLKKSNKVVNTKLIISKYLLGGHSSQNLFRSLKERFKLFTHHFGVLKGIYFHFKILWRAIKFMGK